MFPERAVGARGQTGGGSAWGGPAVGSRRRKVSVPNGGRNSVCGSCRAAVGPVDGRRRAGGSGDGSAAGQAFTNRKSFCCNGQLCGSRLHRRASNWLESGRVPRSGRENECATKRKQIPQHVSEWVPEKPVENLSGARMATNVPGRPPDRRSGDPHRPPFREADRRSGAILRGRKNRPDCAPRDGY